MANDILSGFGPGSSQPQRGRASSGGVMPGETKDVNNYQPPQGPRGIMESQSPGLHGVNSGNTNQPERVQSSGSVGLGGTNHGCCGSQGKY
jgi:hypothetical protein